MNIGISGPIGAGKTTAAKYLASEHGLSYLRYSEVLAEMLGKTDPDKRLLRNYGWDVMSAGNQQSLNQRLLNKMIKGINYVIDGLRHPVDFDTLSSRPPFYLLYIDASPEVRWQRLSSREGARTWEEFLAEERHAVESHLPILKEKAYKIVLNEGSMAQLQSHLEGAFKDIQRLVAQ